MQRKACLPRRGTTSPHRKQLIVAGWWAVMTIGPEAESMASGRGRGPLGLGLKRLPLHRAGEGEGQGPTVTVRAPMRKIPTPGYVCRRCGKEVRGGLVLLPSASWPVRVQGSRGSTWRQTFSLSCISLIWMLSRATMFKTVTPRCLPPVHPPTTSAISVASLATIRRTALGASGGSVRGEGLGN